MRDITQTGSSRNASNFYSGNVQFKSRQAHRQAWITQNCSFLLAIKLIICYLPIIRSYSLQSCLLSAIWNKVNKNVYERIFTTSIVNATENSKLSCSIYLIHRPVPVPETEPEVYSFAVVLSVYLQKTCVYVCLCVCVCVCVCLCVCVCVCFPHLSRWLLMVGSSRRNAQVLESDPVFVSLFLWNLSSPEYTCNRQDLLSEPETISH
jgi:hypothetical protein